MPAPPLVWTLHLTCSLHQQGILQNSLDTKSHQAVFASCLVLIPRPSGSAAGFFDGLSEGPSGLGHLSLGSCAWTAVIPGPSPWQAQDVAPGTYSRTMVSGAELESHMTADQGQESSQGGSETAGSQTGICAHPGAPL